MRRFSQVIDELELKDIPLQGWGAAIHLVMGIGQSKNGKTR